LRHGEAEPVKKAGFAVALCGGAIHAAADAAFSSTPRGAVIL